MLRICLLLLAALCVTLSWAAIAVRVQDTPGGPQIHLNGQPIPPRFFWGAMNSGSVTLSRAKI